MYFFFFFFIIINYPGYKKCYNSASNDLMEHPDETAEKKSSLHNIQEDSSVKNKINTTLNTNDSKKIKILNFRKCVIGSFSQSSSIFCGLGVGLQCVPNSIFSLVYNTGRERLIQSHSSARFSFELSGNSN